MNIDGIGYMADLSKLKSAIEDFRPNTKKGFQKLGGYLGFFRPFVPKISELMLPITNAIKGKVNQEEIQNAKNNILKEIKLNLKIVFPRYTEHFSLHTDSSVHTCAGILIQSHGICGLFSYKFKETETRYNFVEKEFLALLLSLKKFKTLIYGNLTIVKTDNRNLLYDTQVDSSRVQRWKLLLNEYNIILKHVKGIENNISSYV